MKEKELSVIIPFLNEGQEVENTIKSLLEHTKESLDIILVNDHSDDGYDYKGLSNKYGTQYVENKQRVGVAESRNIGVSIASTRYALLLDAHMRFYDEDWYDIVLSHLHSNENCILCCQSLVLWRICGNLRENQTSGTKGAKMNLDIHSDRFLEVDWIGAPEIDNQTELVDIPCILGAGYLFSIKYWNKLHGLNGLYYYGLDEQFLSLKAWMNGGSCKLIPDVKLGHIYRTYAPYNTMAKEILFNKMLITTLLFPESYKYELFAKYKKLFKESYVEAYKMLKNKYEWIDKEKQYLSTICHKDLLSKLKTMNDSIKTARDGINSYPEIEQRFMSVLADDSKNPMSIFYGDCGKLIMCLLWAKYQNNEFFEKLSEQILNKITNSLTIDKPLSIVDGLLGVGLTIEFLNQNNLIDCDTNDILSDIDDKVICLRPQMIKDLSLASGVRGIIVYVYARLIGNNNKKEKYPFDTSFISEIAEVSKKMMTDEKYDFDSYVFENKLLTFLESGEGEKITSLDFVYLNKYIFNNAFNYINSIDKLYSLLYA